MDLNSPGASVGYLLSIALDTDSFWFCSTFLHLYNYTSHFPYRELAHHHFAARFVRELSGLAPPEGWASEASTHKQPP